MQYRENWFVIRVSAHFEGVVYISITNEIDIDTRNYLSIGMDYAEVAWYAVGERCETKIKNAFHTSVSIP